VLTSEGVANGLFEKIEQIEEALMERAYLCENTREYELTKHISLRLHFPLELLRLKATGRCEIEIPEWMFDCDHPGHYLSCIKNVNLTLPAVVGPLHRRALPAHAALTLLSSVTRVQPYLIDDPAVCCEDESHDGSNKVTSLEPYLDPARCCNDDEPQKGYEVVPVDPHIVRHYPATEAIATSSSQNDAGLFELSFHDERYLPFEFQGAISRWRMEVP
jgi:Tc toxin complex TcA C-terminal TcB-binding domain